MRMRWTPLVAPPALAAAAVAFGRLVQFGSSRAGHPAWAAALLAAGSAGFGWFAGARRYAELCGRERLGGPPALAAFGSVFARHVAHLGTLLLAATACHGLASRIPAVAGEGYVECELWRCLAALAVTGVVGFASGRALFPEHPFEPAVRGRCLVSQRTAARLAGRLRPRNDPGLPWGGTRLPSSAAPIHFLACGATGSGKSLTLRMLMQEVLPLIVPGSGSRALIYDAKREALPLLAGMGVRCPVKLLHPLDARGVAWDLARDCTTPAVALQLAGILIPDADEGANRFFTDAARDLLAGVLISLHLCAPGRWTLRDVLLALADAARLKLLLEKSPPTRDRLRYFADERTLANILGTVASKSAAYGPVAAAWDRAGESISLYNWVAGEFILVLVLDDEIRSALDAVNRAVFRRAAELLLAGPESAHRRTWLFLDEVREAGKLDGLRGLLNRGRSKGVAAVLGFQSVEGLREAYGREEAHEIIGECAHKAVLRLESPDTAEWAAGLFGDVERREIQVGQPGAEKAVSKSELVARRPLVLASEFLSLPATGPAAGLSGYFVSPITGAYRHTLAWDEISARLRTPCGETPDYLPRPAADQYLRPWDETDFRRLGLNFSPTSPTDPGHRPRLQVVCRGPGE